MRQNIDLHYSLDMFIRYFKNAVTGHYTGVVDQDVYRRQLFHDLGDFSSIGNVAIERAGTSGPSGVAKVSSLFGEFDRNI